MIWGTMPIRPRAACLVPGCPALAVERGRCADHAGQERQQRRLTETPRPSFRDRGYGSEWDRIRARVLALTPRCRHCGAPATVVDHIVPLRAGGTHDLGNLQALCVKHHNAKTNSVDGGGWRRRGPGGGGVETLATASRAGRGTLNFVATGCDDA